jgi:predicted Fe-Mo cluster-binding NifX family protein
MKHEMIALPVYQERISPLLDVAKKYVLYEIHEGEIKQKINIHIHADNEPLRIEKLKELGVSLIIGGAVSCFVSDIIHGKGIRLISWINGPVDNIVESYIKGDLNQHRIENQKCRRRKRRIQGETDRNEQVIK